LRVSVELTDGPCGSGGVDCGERASTADPRDIRHSESDTTPD